MVSRMPHHAYTMLYIFSVFPYSFYYPTFTSPGNRQNEIITITLEIRKLRLRLRHQRSWNQKNVSFNSSLDQQGPVQVLPSMTSEGDQSFAIPKYTFWDILSLLFLRNKRLRQNL